MQSSTDNQLIINLNSLILQDKIGSGSFGKVYKVKDKKTGQAFAAKISINKINNDLDEMFLSISREVNIISKLNHPSILRFIGYSDYDFKKNLKPTIITEYVPNGSLNDLIKKSDSYFDDTRKLIIAYGIASAMSYLHSNNIIHRDLKPDNVLIDDFLFPKIADFGISKSTNNNQSTVNIVKGTPLYIAPEIWLESNYTKACDVYAYAFIMYEMFTKEKPFGDCNIFQIMAKVMKGEHPEFKNPISKAYQKLIEKCWSNEPENRPSFDQIVSQLATDQDFITSTVREEDFKKYINFIRDSKITFNSSCSEIDISRIICNIKQVKENNKHMSLIYQKVSEKISLFPIKKFVELASDQQNFVKEAENDSKKKYLLAVYLINGQFNYPFDIQTGVKYLKRSFKEGCIESVVYYCKLLIKGQIIPKNHEKVEKILNEYLVDNESFYFLLLGKLRKNQKNYKEAGEYFAKSIQLGNGEAEYEYGQLLYKGQISSIGFVYTKYFLNSIDKNFSKAKFVYGQILREEGQILKGNELIKKAANENYLKAIFYYANLLLNEGNEKKEEAISYLSKGSLLGHVDCIRSYLSFEKDEEKVKHYLKIGSDKGDIELVYRYGLFLIDHDQLKEGVDLVRIAAFSNQSDALTKYCELLLNGQGVEVDVDKAVEFVKKAIDLGNPNAMHLYADMLFYGNGVEINQNEALKYYKMAMDNGRKGSLIHLILMVTKLGGNRISNSDIIRLLTKVQLYEDEVSLKLLIQMFKMILDFEIKEEEDINQLKEIFKAQNEQEFANKFNSLLYKMKANRSKLNKLQITNSILNKQSNNLNEDQTKNNKSNDNQVENNNSNENQNENNNSNDNQVENSNSNENQTENNKINEKQTESNKNEKRNKNYIPIQLNVNDLIIISNVSNQNKKIDELIQKSDDADQQITQGNAEVMSYDDEYVIYKILAENGHIESMFQFAWLNDDGLGCEVNHEEANKYYKMAADKGHIMLNIYMLKNYIMVRIFK